jgi:HTH-type transcriptional regulator, sugar sensing transcriptional regulator
MIILTTMVVNIISELISLGFSEYEAKAYIALLGSSLPMTSYEMAKEAGIPTSKVYEVARKLQEKEVIIPLEEGGKNKYIALEPEEFLRQYQGRFESSFGRIRQEFSRVKEKPRPAMIWNFRDYDQLISRAGVLIEEACESILLSLWKEEFQALEKVLENAEKRGVKIAVMNFGKPELKIGQVFQHPIEDTIYTEKGGRGFTLVIDGREALTATVMADNKVEGAWSRNNGFVTVAEDYIKHDIYIMKVIERFNSDLVLKFGDNYKLLRDVFHDSEL